MQNLHVALPEHELTKRSILPFHIKLQKLLTLTDLAFITISNSSLIFLLHISRKALLFQSPLKLSFISFQFTCSMTIPNSRNKQNNLFCACIRGDRSVPQNAKNCWHANWPTSRRKGIRMNDCCQYLSLNNRSTSFFVTANRRNFFSWIVKAINPYVSEFLSRFMQSNDVLRITDLFYVLIKVL